jgi:hypothetical protein
MYKTLLFEFSLSYISFVTNDSVNINRMRTFDVCAAVTRKRND